MMSENDPRTLQHFVAYRQNEVRAAIARGRASRGPSPLRVAIGQALIRAGEHVQGRRRSASAEMVPTLSRPHLRPARQA